MATHSIACNNACMLCTVVGMLEACVMRFFVFYQGTWFGPLEVGPQQQATQGTAMCAMRCQHGGEKSPLQAGQSCSCL